MKEKKEDKLETNGKWFHKGKLSDEARQHWYNLFFRQLSPFELLQKKLKEFEKDLEKSATMYMNGKIDASLHLTHRENLTKLINSYRYAVQILSTCPPEPKID